MISSARLIALAVLFLSLAAASTASAQNLYGRSYGHGYGFGLGFGPNGCSQQIPPFVVGNFGQVRPAEEPPYFAKFPPVYYSHIIPRPYGVSPYAVPPGIIPSEYMVPAPQREIIKNPYVDPPGDLAPQEEAPTPMVDKIPQDIN